MPAIHVAGNVVVVRAAEHVVEPYAHRLDHPPGGDPFAPDDVLESECLFECQDGLAGTGEDSPKPAPGDTAANDDCVVLFGHGADGSGRATQTEHMRCNRRGPPPML